MRYANIIEDDIVNGSGICVSLFTQGCPHHCPGCFNPETWDFNGGIEIDINDMIEKLYDIIPKNGVQRNFSILGGEPLCKENIEDVALLVAAIKTKFPNIKIFIWTGYYIKDIPSSTAWDIIRFQTDYIIEGPYIEEQRDISLKWRGSRNQRIIKMPDLTVLK